MKKFVLILSVIFLAVILCSCSLSAEKTVAEPTPAPTPTPSYDLTPTESETDITVDGKQLPASYYADDVIYIKLADWAELFGLEESDKFTESGIFDGVNRFVPLAELIEGKGYSELYDEENNHLYYTAIPDVSTIPEGFEVPVLMYHAVSDDCWGIRELFVSPAELEKQLAYLNDNGYTTITFEDLPHINEIEKPVMLTFDDGYLDNYTELFPLLKQYNAKATVFIITDAIYSEKYLKADQIREMSDSGLVSIQSHTVTHAKLGELSEEYIINELELSRLAVCRLTGKEPFVLCYPYGSNSELSREITSQYYSFGLIMSGSHYVTGTDRYTVARSYVSRDTDINSFAAIIG